MMHRYILVMISVFLSLCAYSQKNIATQLNDVLLSHDMAKGEKLISKITKQDIVNMPDSVLLDYHYLAAAICQEKGNKDDATSHLQKVKDLCETKIGIFNDFRRYLEIVRVLGELCEDQGKDDEALLLYEEGIVKAFAFLQVKDKDIQEYIKELRDNAADIFEKQGHSEMARIMRSEKPIDYEGGFDYACDLCKHAQNILFVKYEDIEVLKDSANVALGLLDDAKGIFERSGVDGKEMMQPLNRIYLSCYTSLGDIKSIDKLLKSSKSMFYSDNQSYLVGDMGSVVYGFLSMHHNVEIAEKYYQYLLNEYSTTNQQETKEVHKIGKNLDYYKQAYLHIDSLSQVRDAYSSHNYQWGITSLQLANQLIQVQRQTEGNDICEEVYKMSSRLKDDPNGLHYTILMNLGDYNISKKNYGKAAQYIKEQLTWLDSRNMPKDNEDRGWCYNKLGIAYMNDGKYNEGSRALDKAETILVPIYTKESKEYATILHNKGHLAQLQGKLEEAKTLLLEAKRLQIAINDKSLDRTEQYLNEVEHALNVQL